ncbi:BTB/POZ domain-containing protein KCTD14 [Protopterus annectens]|uniref:BTB/POZ domain-containing protein KCTD14 n=1 Tax=Protopterus annectens TaxID=7888 RepID=UPI001CF97BB5|nr:BTB/POZ domain-containing protein KCTD14 [Protopterus annectens]
MSVSEYRFPVKQTTTNFPTVITLNVGGQIYTTTIATLKKCPESKLANMFNGLPKLRTDADGRYVIDRDGTYFKYVLEYLRSNQIPTQHIQEIYKEAVYYEIEALIKQLEDTPQIFGEQVGRKQFLSRVPNYGENIEVMIRIARAEAVASRTSSVVVCIVKTDEDYIRCSDIINGTDNDKVSVVTFGPWKASPSAPDLLDCIKMDIEAKGYKITCIPFSTEKGFRFTKTQDFLYKFVFTWW